METGIEPLASELLSRCPRWRAAAIEKWEHLAGDASGRRYTRLYLKSAPAPRAILMRLAHGCGPLAAGAAELNQDDTFVLLADFLKANGIRVPEVICDGRDAGALLVEDVGDAALWHFALGRLTPAEESIRGRLGEDAVLTLFRRAADMIADLQRIPPDPGCPAFQRAFEFTQYRAEAMRFLEHFLAPRNLLSDRTALITGHIDEICLAAADHPRRLVHRDFMPWNLFADGDGALCVIDFQDALRGSYAYDLASLLHDRDVDFALGPERCRQVFNHFRERLGLGSEFRQHYFEALLQRHLRLAGQFCLLTQKTGSPGYLGWVPGCLRRIGRALARMPERREFLRVLAQVIPDVKAGAAEPLTL